MNNTTKTRALGYIQGLLLRIGRANCTNLAKCCDNSHDSFTKLLNTTIDCGSIVATIMFRIFGSIEGGNLIIDETTINKSFSKIIEGCSWIWSNRDSKYVFGYHITLMLWSDGTLTVPLALRVYKKSTDKKTQVTAIDHCVELLRYARYTLKIKPDWILMDGFYSADKVLGLLHDWKWRYLMRVKKNRILNGTKIKDVHRNPYWEETGTLKCGLRVRIIRHGKRYFITNEFKLEKKRVYDKYVDRWTIEEVFRVLHSELGLDECESRSRSAQMIHFHLSLVAYGVLECEKTRSEHTTHYRLVEKCRLNPSFVEKLDIARVLEGA